MSSNVMLQHCPPPAPPLPLEIKLFFSKLRSQVYQYNFQSFIIDNLKGIGKVSQIVVSLFNGFFMTQQSIFNGSNTFWTMKISSKQGKFELIKIDNCARSGGIIRIFLTFYNTMVCCVFSLESPH